MNDIEIIESTALHSMNKFEPAEKIDQQMTSRVITDMDALTALSQSLPLTNEDEKLVHVRIIQEAKKAQTWASRYFDKVRDSAHKTWLGIKGMENDITLKAAIPLKISSDKIIVYDTECERKQKEIEERQQREAEVIAEKERQAIRKEQERQAELARKEQAKIDEANRKEQHRIAEEQAKARKSRDKEWQEVLAKQQAEAQKKAEADKAEAQKKAEAESQRLQEKKDAVQAQAPTVGPLTERTTRTDEGSVSSKPKTEVTVTDLESLVKAVAKGTVPLTIIKINEATLKSWCVSSGKMDGEVPGVKITGTKSVAVRIK